ncbi:MAG: hypothetical protein PVG59_14170, partial [Desulfobacterales bacterium]
PIPDNSGMNYQQRNRALSEWFRERCERTAITPKPPLGANLILGLTRYFIFDFCSFATLP